MNYVDTDVKSLLIFAFLYIKLHHIITITMKRLKFATTSCKVILACLLMSVTGIVSVNAQAAFHFGFGAGVQFTNLNSDIGTYNMQTGFHGGIVNEIRFNDHFSTELDIFYSTKGAQKAYTETTTGFLDGSTQKYTFNRSEALTYVDGHLLFKWNIPLGYDRVIPYDRPGKRVFLSLYAGPQFGYLIGYKSTGYTDTTKIPVDPTDTLTPITKTRNKGDYDNATYKSQKGSDGILKTDIGLTVGAGIYFLMGDRATLSFDVRYTQGFGSIDGIAYSKRVVNIDQSDIRNSSIQYKQAQINSMVIATTVGIRWRIIGAGPNRNF